MVVELESAGFWVILQQATEFFFTNPKPSKVNRKKIATTNVRARVN
jgi:hypothetical protein